MNKIKIVLADDHRLVREGFKALLKKNKDFEIIGEAENGKELLTLLENSSPDLLLLDLSMPDLSGLDVLKKLQSLKPELKVIMLTMHEESDYILQSVQLGVDGYLLKNTEPDELYSAINAVASGQKYFTPVVSNILVSNISKLNPKPELLTEREKEVLRYVTEGLSAKMIGEKLFISARTVETHKVNIMKKLEVSNTAELVRRAMEEKLF